MAGITESEVIAYKARYDTAQSKTEKARVGVELTARTIDEMVAEYLAGNKTELKALLDDIFTGVLKLQALKRCAASAEEGSLEAQIFRTTLAVVDRFQADLGVSE